MDLCLTMVVAELLQWGAPLQLVLCLVLLASHEKACKLRIGIFSIEDKQIFSRDLS